VIGVAAILFTPALAVLFVPDIRWLAIGVLLAAAVFALPLTVPGLYLALGQNQFADLAGATMWLFAVPTFIVAAITRFFWLMAVERERRRDYLKDS
jgi:hypothetical protein